MHTLLVLAMLAGSVREGIWQSNGYGEILEVRGATYALYDVTRSTCVQREHGTLDPATPLYPEISYRDDEMFVGGTDYRYSLQRIAALPERCTAAVDPNDPFLNFDAFWEEMNENYAFFALRKLDWQAMRTSYRARVRKEMSERDLYDLLGEMIATINDPHVFLSNRKPGAANLDYSTRDVHGVAAALQSALPGRDRAFYNQSARQIEAAIDTMVRFDVLHGRFKTALNDKFTWGRLTPEIGYIRASLFMQMFPPPPRKREEVDRLVDEAVDAIFADLATASALVIDVGTNTGGADVAALAIAKRIVPARKVWMTKRARTPDGFTPRETFELAPGGTHRFAGPVVILQSTNTVSAAETLTEALVDVPAVRRAGTQTLGARSSILMKPLPNGGIVGISNEETTASDGKVYEMVGVPADVPVVVFDPSAPVTGYARAIEAAAGVAKGMIR